MAVINKFIMSNSSAFNNQDHPPNQHRHTSSSHPYTPYNQTASNSSKLRQSYNNSHLNHSNSNDQSDYEIVAEFQLRRQRQKTRILEERLHNKEIFIQQMKEYQEQLTVAFERCQEELILAKKTIDKLMLIERQQNEEIADLKHLVIRLQDEINLKEIVKSKDRKHYSSVKAPQKDEDDEDEEEQDDQENQSLYLNQKTGRQSTKKFQGRKQRSKTQMNQQEQSPLGKFKDSVEEELIKESRKIAKFLKQFLMMCQCFLGQIEKGLLKNRLKLAWKWIKQVVKQWNEQEKQKLKWAQFLQKAQQRVKIPQQLEEQEKLERILKYLKACK